MSVSGKQVKLTVMDGSHVTSDCGKSDGEADEWLERGDHPLMNDLILKTFLGVVRRYDLTACRGVCKKWNVRTIPRMRDAFKITIHGKQFRQFKDKNSEFPEDTIDHFVKLLNSNELGIPFGKFDLGVFPTAEGVGQQFLQLCGETATEIDLDEGGTEIYKIEDISEILKCSPNLKVLGCPSRIVSRSGNMMKLFPHSIPTLPSLRKITFRSEYEKERLEFCPSWTEELLTAAPNVSDIVADDGLDQPDEYERNSGISYVLNCIEKLGREPSIQSLNLSDARKRHIDHLRRMTEKENGLKLKSLTFEPYHRSGDNFATVLIELATILKDTLQHMTLVEPIHNVNWTEFPFMPDLKSLTYRIFNQYIFSMPVNLNNYFPALEKLNIGLEDNDEDWDVQFPAFQSEVCPTIKSLNVEDVGVMKTPTFHNMLRVFPNLTKLDFQVTEDCVENLRQVWTLLAQLESLSIHVSIKRAEYLDLDSLFTGIPSQRLRRLRPVGNELEKMSVEQRKERILKLRNDHSRFSSIGDLTKLRRLNLNATGEVRRSFYTQTGSGSHTYRLTDLTAYLALYSMKHLSHLDVQNCTFTKTCCKILTKETGLESWSFQNGKQMGGHIMNIINGHIIPPFVLRDGDSRYN